MSKTIPLSVRISQDDASFIARVTIPGAVTPSEKVRALIAQARERQQSEKNPADAASLLSSLFEARRLEIRRLEEKTASHSELITQLGAWLPRFLALFMSTPLSRDLEAHEALRRLERGVVREIMSLMEGVLRLAVTREEPCYDPRVISSQIGVVKELIDLVHASRFPGRDAEDLHDCLNEALKD